VLMGKDAGERGRGVRSVRRWMAIARPGRTAPDSRALEFQSAAASTTERIAAILGPRAGFPRVSNFFVQIATGRMEFRQIITQLQFRIFPKTGEFFPERERVVAGFGERTPGQCCGAGCFDLFPNPIQ